MVFSSVLFLHLLAFMSMNHHVVGWRRKVLTSACIVSLFCWIVLRLFGRKGG